jgi:predicted RNA-binding protein with PUA-like domain
VHRVVHNASMKHWLVKTEPHVYSIDDLKRDTRTLWTGVRNYQARNFLREMSVGDLVLVYHSNAEPPGVVGVAKVTKPAEPDPTQFDKRSEYYDEKATHQVPRWFCPELGYVRTLGHLIALADLRDHKGLSGLTLLQPGSRLSVIPVSEKHFKLIVDMPPRA